MTQATSDARDERRERRATRAARDASGERRERRETGATSDASDASDVRNERRRNNPADLQVTGPDHRRQDEDECHHFREEVEVNQRAGGEVPRGVGGRQRRGSVTAAAAAAAAAQEEIDPTPPSGILGPAAGYAGYFQCSLVSLIAPS